MFKIKDFLIGGDSPTYIIAEIGTNHCLDIEHTKKLITACADAGANAVKFQSWTPLGLQNIFDFDKNGVAFPAPALPVLEKYMLPDAWHKELQNFCIEKNMHFLSTPFDPERARFLFQLGVPAFKISSSDVTYHDLLETCAKFGLPVLMSTGMANLDEIHKALAIVQAYNTPVALLHCVGAYPPKPEDANLRAISSLTKHFRTPVGFSDHSPSHDFVLAAVALGARIIEKHVTLSRSDGAPDSPFALEPQELKALVNAVRLLETGLGDGEKRCMPSEVGGLRDGRRGIYAKVDITPGTRITGDMLAVVRPCLGVGADSLTHFVGATCKRHIAKGYPLTPDAV